MLIDKKREEMFFRCRMRKKKLDLKMNLARSFLILPPTLYLIFTVIDVFMNIFSDVTVLATGAIFYGYDSKGSPFASFLTIIGCIGLILLAACITIFDTDKIKIHTVKIYTGATLLYILFGVIFKAFDPLIVALFALCALPLAFWHNKLKEEDYAMSSLDGYPHFNTLLLINNDTPVPVVTKEQLDGMTDDERIMFERDDGRRNI